MTFYGPELNDGKHVFVFGSNWGGIHGAGAAKTALDHWGAILKVGQGRQGMAYGIPTKDRLLRPLPLADIEKGVHEFKEYARQHPELTFLVTRVGCGLAGYSDSQIHPFFEDSPDNCVMPDDYWGKPCISPS